MCVQHECGGGGSGSANPLALLVQACDNMARNFRYPSGLLVVGRMPAPPDEVASAPSPLERHEAASNPGAIAEQQRRGALDALQLRPPPHVLAAPDAFAVARHEHSETWHTLRPSGAAVRRSASRRRNEPHAGLPLCAAVQPDVWPPGAISLPSPASGSGSASFSASSESDSRSPTRNAPDRSPLAVAVAVAERRAQPRAGDPLGALETLCSQIYPLSADALKQREREQFQQKASLPSPPPLRPVGASHVADSSSQQSPPTDLIRWWQALLAEQSRQRSQQCTQAPPPPPPPPPPLHSPPRSSASSELSGVGTGIGNGNGAGLLSGLRAALPHLHAGCNVPNCEQCARERLQFYAALYQYSQSLSLSQLARPARTLSPAASAQPPGVGALQQSPAGAIGPQCAAACVSSSSLQAFYSLFPALASAMPAVSVSGAPNTFPVAENAEPPAAKRPFLMCPQPPLAQLSPQSQTLPNSLLQAFLLAQMQQLASDQKLASPAAAAAAAASSLMPAFGAQMPFALLSPNSKAFGAVPSPPSKPPEQPLKNVSPSGRLQAPVLFPGGAPLGMDTSSESQHVCNWLQSGVFCGRRFESAESLWRHLRAHVDVSSASPPLPSPDHLLASCASASGPGSLTESDASPLQPYAHVSRRQAHHSRRIHHDWQADAALSSPDGRRTRTQRSGRQLELRDY